MSFRVPIVAGNWKMNKDCNEAIKTAQQLVKHTLRSTENIEVIVIPSFVSLFAVSSILKKSNIYMGAQNVFWKEEGAFTGEISAKMLKNVGCKYVIIGHSERRHFFCETNDTVNKKIKATLACGMHPILCLGETELDRKKGETFSIIDQQIRIGLDGVLPDYMSRVILAYEPVWAIGSGNAAKRNQVQEVHSFVRFSLKKLYSFDLAKSIRIIYGGSISSANIEKIMSMPDIDGVLVGGASLNWHVFSKLIQLVNQLK